MERFALFGDIIYSSSEGKLMEFPSSYLVIEDGRVCTIKAERPENIEIHDYSGMLIIPGLTDLHLHAPQFQFAGLYMDEELLEWLNRHTFPEEGRYGDLEYAEKAYSLFVQELLQSETTRFSAFATIHEESALLLCSLLEKSGLSGYVGKVNMDRNSPPYLTEDTEESIKSTITFIEKVGKMKNIRAIITPRFIPSCSNKLLMRLGELSRSMHLPVQSHLDENISEIEWVRSLLPESRNYADAYDLFGLLGKEKTIMAHVVWPKEEEIELLRNENIYVAHSPSSNSNLSSGIAPVRKMLERGVKVALATDVAGGSSLSILRMLTHSIEVSKLYFRLVDDSMNPLTFAEAFHMASRVGGSFFGSVGAFDRGFEADAVVLDSRDLRSVHLKDLTLSERLELYSYRKAGTPVKAKYVKGVKIL